mgnify:CR=1 FL=1
MLRGADVFAQVGQQQPTAAEAIAVAGYFNAGQDCTAATRVYVERNAHQQLVDAIAATLDRVRPGDPFDTDTDIGPLITAEHRDRVTGFIDRARSAGATVVTGGTALDREGFFLRPAVVTGCDQRSELVQDEVFGPVLAVLPFDHEDDAVAMANDSAYGLASSVWTDAVDRGLRIAHRLKAGVTWVNDHLPIDRKSVV